MRLVNIFLDLLKVKFEAHAKICKEKPQGQCYQSLFINGKAVVLSAMYLLVSDKFHTIVLIPMEMDAIGKTYI